MAWIGAELPGAASVGCGTHAPPAGTGLRQLKALVQVEPLASPSPVPRVCLVHPVPIVPLSLGLSLQHSVRDGEPQS